MSPAEIVVAGGIILMLILAVGLIATVRHNDRLDGPDFW